ncbi:MAG: ABC transporter ATP-binding protein, partial [Deltaproteobacteria bacterium]|nr:ABC transporter ATP-binding protein [Deltaproteobacteria bacterium]
AGQIVRIGTPRELLAEPGHPAVAAFLEAPRRHARLLGALQ